MTMTTSFRAERELSMCGFALGHRPMNVVPLRQEARDREFKGADHRDR
jgi:hypothetical protein